MIDNLIVYIAECISSTLKATTIMKYALIMLIISLFSSLWLGIDIVVISLAINNVVWLVTEFLYAKGVEDSIKNEDSEQ